VILSGPVTSKQKQRVLCKTESINTEWVMEACNWLRANNSLHENVPIPNIEAPTAIDNSIDVNSANTDFETKDDTSVIFFDSTVNVGRHGYLYEQMCI